MGRVSALVLGTALSMAATPALAQTASDQDKALAATLFDAARALLAQGKVADACRKLEESRRLDPLPGTLLNLAACHEREGLTASAMAEFREARAMAERDHRDDRVKFADEHLSALTPKLSMLVIVVPPEVDAATLTVTRDGIAIGRAAWGTRIPVDPGVHVVEATAPGKQPWRAEIRVAPAGDVETATIAPLVDAPPTAPPPVPPNGLVIAPPVSGSPIAPPAPSPPRGGLSTRREWAVVSAGVGLFGIGAGSFFGARAISLHNEPSGTCTSSPCSPASVSLNHEAATAADISTTAFAVALAGVGVAAFLWFGDSVAVSPSVGGLEVAGRF